MAKIFLILFSFLFSSGINQGPILRKISKDQLKDPKKISYVLTKISKYQLKSPGLK